MSAPSPPAIAFAALLCVGAVLAQDRDQSPNRHLVVDCSKIERRAPKLPEGLDNCRYGLAVFGARGDVPVWFVMAGGSKGGRPDVLFVDLDADGDLTEAGERFEGDKDTDGVTEFVLGDLREPRGDVVHRDVKVKWTKASVRMTLKWRGEKVTFGGYGPRHDTYAGFAATPAEAPIFVPGWDRPFAFERWLEDPLHRDRDVDFKVFVGNRGDRTGTFFAVDDHFLPEGEYAVATLSYRTRDGAPATKRFELRKRC